jgi:uncharacterized protein
VKVELVYGAGVSDQYWAELDVPVGASIADVIGASDLLSRYPEIDLATARVGVYSVLKTLASRVEAGDRVEVYRSLLVDPKEARRRRAAKRSGN